MWFIAFCLVGFFAGLIAREISETSSSAAEARDAVLARAVRDSDPTIGPHLELRVP